MAIYSNTRTIHTITIDLPDDVLAKIESCDEVEVVFNSRLVRGRTPRPTRLSYSTLRWVMGWD